MLKNQFALHKAVFVFFCLASFTGSAEILEGKVVRIVDGDTLVLLDANKVQHRVRLSGIDTPERGQPFGKRATENLARLTGNRPARLEWYKQDRWKRLIGTVWVHSPDTSCRNIDCPKTLDVGMAQLTQGLAWHFKRYAHEQPEEERERYSFAEHEAKSKRVGLWSDPDPVPPWEWRKQ